MLHLIVDGYNIIRAQDYQWNLKGDELRLAREKLVAELNDYLANREHKITVVFDSSKSDIDIYLSHRLKIGKINIIFSEKDETADDVIKRLVKEAPIHSNILVATSDKGIIEFVRKFNVKVIPARSFYNRIKSRQEKLNKVDYFEKYIKGYIPERQKIKYKKLKKRERTGPKLW